MAFQTIGGVYFPPLPNLAVLIGGTAVTNHLLNASGQKLACIFRAPATGTLDRFEFLTGTVLTGGPMKWSFQGVSLTTGDPDGVIGQYRVKTISGLEDNNWIPVTSLTSDGTDSGSRRSVTKGDLVAAVVEFNAFTSESVAISMMRFATTADGLNQNYTDNFTPSTWTKGTTTGCGFAIIYTGDVCYPIPSSGFTSGLTYQLGMTTGTSPDEAGALITVPFTCKVDALYAVGDFDGDCDLVLYSGTTQVASAFMDPNVRLSGNAGCSILPLASEITLTPGSYRVTVRPTTLTNCWVNYLTMWTASHKRQYVSGDSISWTQRTDAGAFTEIDTRLVWCGFRISALSDVETGGGGGGTGISRSRTLGGM